MLRWFFAGVLSIALLGAPAPHAQAETIYARDVDKILAIAQSFGAAELKSDGGRTMIQGRMADVTYLILFYGCSADGADCTDIQFGALWDARADPSPSGPDLPRANQWNREKRFGNAYIDADGTVIIKMESNIEFGVDRRTLEDTFDWWRLALEEFPTFYFR